MSTSAATPVAAKYAERVERFGGIERRLARLAFQLTIALRAIAVLAAIAGVVAAFEYRSPAAWAALAGLLLASSTLLMIRDRREHERRRYEQLRMVNEQALARIARRWDDLHVPAVKAPQEFSDISADLEIFGRASLFQLVSTAESASGVRELRQWLSTPAAPEVARERQQAVAALAPELDRRQEFQVCGRLLAQSLTPPLDFLRWAESDRPAFGPVVIWLSRLSALAAALLIAGLALGLFSAELGGSALAGLFLANALFTAIFGGQVYAALNAVASGVAEARLNHGLYRLADGFPRTGAILSRIASRLDDAMHEMGRLEKLVALAGLRRWLILYFPLEFLFLWDFHVVLLLERWRAAAGKRYRGWFDAVGELEALCALAALAHDNPAWSFPEFKSEPRTIEAAELGHPLIAEDVRVANDVIVGPPGEILMVTGSNMSGKSTLLRAIGVNIVLAQAGGPVCAAKMSLPPTELATVMRVSDSLERGVSLFMAELRRLKQVVDRTNGSTSRTERQLCYLLDEILHGTNTSERHMASVRILERLVSAGAIGAVSTHDLGLCQAPEFGDRCRNVHFQETIWQDADRVRMTFDYRLRPGIAQTTNVRFLLDAVGLPPLEGNQRNEKPTPQAGGGGGGG